MKKALILLSIIALMCVFTVPAAFAETYALSVQSSNPSSGVAITVSPNDTAGKSSGTTQFTRTYSSGASVTLTASATAGGNIFKEWRKNGEKAGSKTIITVTISANTAMTAVYA